MSQVRFCEGRRIAFMVEYCDTPHIEREEKQGIQNIPKKGGDLNAYLTNKKVVT